MSSNGIASPPGVPEGIEVKRSRWRLSASVGKRLSNTLSVALGLRTRDCGREAALRGPRHTIAGPNRTRSIEWLPNDRSDSSRPRNPRGSDRGRDTRNIPSVARF